MFYCKNCSLRGIQKTRFNSADCSRIKQSEYIENTLLQLFLMVQPHSQNYTSKYTRGNIYGLVDFAFGLKSI